MLGALSSNVNEFPLTCPRQKLQKKRGSIAQRYTVMHRAVRVVESSMMSFCLSPEYQWQIAIEK